MVSPPGRIATLKLLIIDDYFISTFEYGDHGAANCFDIIKLQKRIILVTKIYNPKSWFPAASSLAHVRSINYN